MSFVLTLTVHIAFAFADNSIDPTPDCNFNKHALNVYHALASLCYDDARSYCLLYAFSDGSIACIVYDTTITNVLLVILGQNVNRARFVLLSASGSLIMKV